MERTELIELMNEAERRGDMDTAKAALIKLESMQPVDRSAELEAFAKGQSENPRKTPENPFNLGTLSDIVTGTVGQHEAVKSMVSGMAGDMVGNYAAGIQMLNPNKPASALPAVKERVANRFVYQPRTAAGQRIVKGVGEMMEPVGELVDKARLGDEALAAGLPESVAVAAEAIPEVAGAGLMGMGLRKPKTPEIKVRQGRIEPTISSKTIIRDNIRNKTGDASTAKFKLAGDKVIVDPKGTAAVRQGFSEPIVAMVKTVSKAERAQYRKMVKIVKSKMLNAYEQRLPSDIAGESLVKRINHVKAVNNNSKGLLGRVAGDLKGKPVDVSRVVSDFKSKVAELGGQYNEKGKLVFGVDSQLYKQPALQRALATMMDKVNALGPNPDAFKVHQFKQFIDEFVSYGKAQQSGISGTPQAMLKSMRHDLNESLKGFSSKYDKVNTAYSETREALDAFQKVAGKNMDLSGPRVDSATGTLLRRLLGNAQSRIPLEQAANNMEAVATKYKGRFDTNLHSQMKMVNELERIFGPSNETSFKAEIGQSIGRGVENLSVRQGAVEAAKSGYRAAMRINQEQAFKAIENLLAD